LPIGFGIYGLLLVAASGGPAWSRDNVPAWGAAVILAAFGAGVDALVYVFFDRHYIDGHRRDLLPAYVNRGWLSSSGLWSSSSVDNGVDAG
jgi:hypothetical protein